MLMSFRLYCVVIVGVVLSIVCWCAGMCCGGGRGSGIEMKGWMRQDRWVVFGEGISRQNCQHCQICCLVALLWILFIMVVRIMFGDPV